MAGLRRASSIVVISIHSFILGSLPWKGCLLTFLFFFFLLLTCSDEFPNILYSLEHSQPPSGLVIDKESEVYKMLQEKQESNEPPKQSTSFLVLQEILESEEKGNQLCVRSEALVQNQL